MLDTNIIEGHLWGFAKCAAEAEAAATQDRIYGDIKCAQKKELRAMFYWWAADVMARTPTANDDECSCAKCVTDAFACDVIRLMSPGCITCGCGGPDDVPTTCDITPGLTVYQSADVLEFGTLPNVAGRQTLIVSNNTGAVNAWSTHLGDIATDDGAGNYTYTTPVTDTIIYAGVQDTYYVAYPGGAGPYFPAIDGDQVFANLTLLSRVPYVSLLYARTVIVEVSVDQITWTPVYSGPETPLAYGGVTVVVVGSPEYTRTTYFYGEENECNFQYAEGTIPPFVFPPCGILEYDITPEAICLSDDWRVEIEFTQIDGWNIGTVTPTVNGVAGTAQNIVLGTLTFGPYVMGDLVTFSIVNNLDGACDITSPTYFDPRVVEQDYNVLRAVDANEYAALSGDGNDYYIVSNVDGLPPVPGEWSDNFGSIWLGLTSTYQAVANLETVYATNPGGALGFWQDDAGVPEQYFPQPTYTYNTVTLIAEVTLPPVAPFTSAWPTLFMQALWTPPAGSPVTLWNNAPDLFTTQAFTIPVTTTWPAVTGRATYLDSNGCGVPVDALTDTYTPTGDPDPEFAEVGLNQIVRCLARQPNGQFLAGGSFTAYDEFGTNIVVNRLARINGDGTLDTAFNDIITDTSFMRVAGAGTAAVDGKYLQGATINGRPSFDYSFSGVDYSISWSGVAWEIFNDTTATLLYHSNDDVPLPAQVTTWVDDAGALPVPAVTTGGFDNRTDAIAVDSLGRITVVGYFTTFNDLPAPKIVRLNADGTRDTAFMVNVGTGFNGFANTDVEVQDDNKLIITGLSTSYNGVTTNRITRLNADGTLDAAFQSGALPNGFNGASYRCLIDQDGTIIVNNGTFSTYNGQLVQDPAGDKTLVRISADGASVYIIAQGRQFEEASPPTSNEFELMANGDILCVGAFTFYNGIPVGYIVRLNSFGDADAAFVANSGVGFDDQTYSASEMANGQIMVTMASTTSYQTIAQNGLTRLNADGTLDATWNMGTGFNNAVYCSMVDSFGSLIVGGQFTTLDGVPRVRIAKFL